MATEKIGVAIVSISGQQKSYAQALYDNPKVEVVAVTDDDPPAAEERANREWADEHGAPFVPDLDDVLARDDVQAVSLCSPIDRRVALVEKVAQAGKHILADKPLTETLADGDAIIEAVDGAGVKMMVGHNFRFNPAILDARESLKRGEVGLPWAIHSEWVIATGAQAAAIGELRTHAMYPLDAILYLVPEKVRSVYAITGSYFFDNAKEAGVEDLAFITMEMDRGIIATTSLGRTPVQHTNGYGGDQTIRVMGTHGMLFLDANRPSWTAHGRSGTTNLKYGPAQMDSLIDHFVTCILEDRTPMCGPRDARNALEITLAALQSSRENRVVKLPLPV